METLPYYLVKNPIKMTPSISILIITYNRPEDTLALLQDIYKQSDWNSYLLEVLVLNNHSDKSYKDLIDWMEKHPDFPINYIDHPENLGVARGRNFLFKKAKGEHLLFLDDDVLLKDLNLFTQLDALIHDPFIVDNKVAITTLNVHYYETKAPQISAFPHKKYDKYKNKAQFLTYYFTGCAHLVDARVVKDVGYYPEDFFYGMEEYDFSFRVLDAGWNIAYDNRITIWHKESPTGRLPKIEQWLMMWENKCKVAYKYLPDKYYKTTYWFWMIHLIKTFKNPFPIFKRGIKISKNIPKETPQKISKETLAKLKELEARLKY